MGYQCRFYIKKVNFYDKTQIFISILYFLFLFIMIETAFNMKNQKLFINGLSSFLIIGGFLSPSYSVFAMKRSPKMKGSPNKAKKMTSERLPKIQNWKELYDSYSKMESSKKKNKINSKREYFLECNRANRNNFNTYSDLFKDENFRKLVLNKDDFQALEEKFHIMERMVDFDKGQAVFLKKFMDINTTVCQKGVLFTVGQKDELRGEVLTVGQEFDLLGEILSKNQKHILLFPSHVKKDNDNLIPVPQEISMELLLSNVASLFAQLSKNIQDKNLFVKQLMKVKLLFFTYATGLYFFYKINTIKQEDLPAAQLKYLLYIPIFINNFRVFLEECFNIDNLFLHTDFNLKEEGIHAFCGDTVILNRLDQNEQRLLKNISQHLEARYTNFLAQYDLKNIDISSSQFSEKLKQLLSSEKSQDLLPQFLWDITFPFISLLRHFKGSGFVFFAGKDTDGKYVRMNLLKDLPFFEKRAGFLTEVFPNCVKDDKKLLTNTIAAMEGILGFIPVTFSIIESEEQCKKDIDLNQNFSFYKFSENAEISTEYPKFTINITGGLGNKINDILKNITSEELNNLNQKIKSLINGGYINIDGHLSRSFYDLKYIVTILNQDAAYYCFSFPSISDFEKYLDDILDSFSKLKEDVDIIEPLVESLNQITYWHSQYRGIPADRKAFFADIHSNISSINEKLKTCLNQLEDENSHINEEWKDNIIDQQEELGETIQDFEAKKKLMNKVSTWLNKLRNLVGILRNTNTNISKTISRTKKATKSQVKTKTNHKLSVPISSFSDLGNINGELDNILEQIDTLESNFFKGSLSEEKLKMEVSSLKEKLDGIAQKLKEGKVKQSYMEDTSLDQSLNAQNEVVKYEQNQIFFINGHVKNEAESFINQNGIYKEDMNKFIQSLGDGSINSHPFHTNTLYFQKFSKEDQNTINKCIKDFDIQYVCYKEQNGQNSSLRILYGIDKKKNNVIIFYVGAPFHKGSKASTLSSKNFTDFALQPL